MTNFRIALANLPFPSGGEDSVKMAQRAIAQAASEGAGLVCFPEAFIPGYRGSGKTVAGPDATFLRSAWDSVAKAARQHRTTVVLGTERVEADGIRLSAMVIDPEGRLVGFQDKVQLDPSEEGTYVAGAGRRVFQTGPLRFGIVICHEGWRYPETVRWAVRQGAHIVFHPQFHEADGDFVPTRYADPANTFHEKAVLCRAAENTCYFATVNYASPRSPTTSAVAGPDGGLLAHMEYGRAGLLLADLDLARATGLLARRYRPI